MLIHQLLARPHQHGQFFAARIRQARLSALERMRQTGMSQELPSDRLSLDPITLPAPGTLPASIRRQRDLPSGGGMPLIECFQLQLETG